MSLCLVSYALVCLATPILLAQPDTLWTRTFGGPMEDKGYSIQLTQDSGYIIAGLTYSFGAGGADVWLIKTDSLGDTLWTKTYGGINDDWAECVDNTYDGGYIIVGTTRSFGAGAELWLLRTNSLGDTLWTRTYDRPGGGEHGYSVQETSDRGYIIAGETFVGVAWNGDVWLIKTDSLGDTLWTKAFGGGGYDGGESVLQTQDGGYITTGPANLSTSTDVWVIRTNDSGDTLWTRNFGGTGEERSECINFTQDGCYIIVGETSSFGAGEMDVWLIKINSSGGTLWTRTFGGSDWDRGYSVEQTYDGGYIIAGRTNSFGAGGYDIWLIRTDSLGSTLWTQTFGGGSDDGGEAVHPTSDSGYIITGWTKSYGAGNEDVWLIKTKPEIGVEESSKLKVQNAKLECHPNPFIASTTISYQIPYTADGGQWTAVSLKIYDVAGNLIHTLVDKQIVGTQFIVSDNIVWHPNGLPPGIYFAKLNTGTHNLIKKLILIR